MRTLSIFFLVIVLISCGQKDTPVLKKQEVAEVKESLEVQIRRHAEVGLGINATEKYDLAIYKEHLNDDDSIDYIVTINRYANAIDMAIESGKVAKYVEVGYMGNHNHFFYVNGKDKKLGAIIPIPSSPHAPLKISFESIVDSRYKDILIDHHIKNAIFRDYYSVYQDSPMEVLKSEICLNLGEDDEKGFVVEFAEGTHSAAKDVIIHEASIDEYRIENPDDIYKVYPNRVKKDKVVYHWIFHTGRRQYYLKR